MNDFDEYHRRYHGGHRIPLVIPSQYREEYTMNKKMKWLIQQVNLTRRILRHDWYLHGKKHRVALRKALYLMGYTENYPFRKN